MKVLILGGTVFLGRYIAEEALRRGHEVTLFTRGQHNPDLFPEAEHLRGDRTQDLSPLQGRAFDAVIDTSGYFPRVVGNSARLLSPNVGHYTFISTMSVYADVSAPGVDENSPVGTIEDPSIEEITGESYGPLKALCEVAVEEAMPGSTTIVRPGLIVGPNDPSDRFTYWPFRVAQGGQVLAPEGPDTPVQYIDVRDLAVWTLDMTLRRATGIFNATGRPGTQTLGDLLELSRVASGSDAQFVWVTPEFLEEQEIQGWSDLPLWLPPLPEYRGFNTMDVSRAVAAGLRFRPTSETVADTQAWTLQRSPDHEWRAGLTPEREAAALNAWTQRAEAG